MEVIVRLASDGTYQRHNVHNLYQNRYEESLVFVNMFVFVCKTRSVVFP